MPYKSVKELPKHLNKYSPKLKRQWMHVFNNTFTKTKSEARAFKAANSVLKKRFNKRDSMEKNTRADHFSLLVDDFLKNI